MSDDEARSLPPTPKRIADALARGQCARSHVASAALSIAASGALAMIAAQESGVWLESFRAAARLVAERQSDPATLAAFARALLASPASWSAIGVAWAGSMVATAVAALSCGGLTFAIGALRIQAARVAFSAAMKKFIPPDGANAIVAASGALATGVAGAGVALRWSPIADGTNDFAAAAVLLGAAVAELWRIVSLIACALAFIDVLIQRRRFRRSLRMTLRELKDERAQADGRPEVKARRRGVAVKHARDLRVAAIKRATAVVTNPTHIAIALRYAPPAIDVPIVVARGADLRAGIVRGAADAYGVPVVESPELARMLYADVEVDSPIPEDCYAAVAAVFAWIIRTRGVLAGAETDEEAAA